MAATLETSAPVPPGALGEGLPDPIAVAAMPVQPPDRVELREYGRAVLPLTDEQAAALNRVGSGQYLSVEPGEHSGHWQVSAHNYVGSINVAGLQVLVRPKIPLRNLFLLLEVGLRERDWRDEAVRFETTGDLLPALVSFFARTTETTLARGLYHSTGSSMTGLSPCGVASISPGSSPSPALSFPRPASSPSSPPT